MGDSESGTGPEPAGDDQDWVQGGPPEEPPEHDLVANSLRASSTPVPSATVTLTGLFGKSEDPGKRRVYFSPQLNQYAEFNASDVVRYDPVPAAQSSVTGYDATQVTLKRGSPVAFTQTRTESVSADDQFDLDARVAVGTFVSIASLIGFITTDICRTMLEPPPPPHPGTR